MAVQAAHAKIQTLPETIVKITANNRTGFWLLETFLGILIFDVYSYKACVMFQVLILN